MSNATASIVNLVASILAAAATVVLAIFAIRQWRVMKENNEAAERQNELVRERWKREDLLDKEQENRLLLDFFCESFDSPEMREMRTRFAYSLFAWNPVVRYENSFSPPAFSTRGVGVENYAYLQNLIAFFSKIGELESKGQLDLGGIDLKFGDYIFYLACEIEARSIPADDSLIKLRDRLKTHRATNKIACPLISEKERKFFWYPRIDRAHTTNQM